MDRHIGEVEAVAGGIEPNDVGRRRVDEEHTARGATDWCGCGCGCGRHCVNGDPRQGIELHISESNTTFEFDAAGKGTGEAGVVIEGYLIGNVVSAQIDIGEVIRLGGPTHQGTEIDVSIGQAIGETIPAHPRGLTTVGLLGEVIAIANQITGLAGVGPEDVIHGLLRQSGVRTIRIVDTAGIDIRQEGRIGGIAQGTPLADPAQAPRRDLHAITAGDPVVQPALHLLLDGC